MSTVKHQDRLAKGLYWDRALKLVDGCTPVSVGCDHCWSMREAHMRSFSQNEKIKAQYCGLTDGDGKWNGRIRLVTKNLYLPLRVKKPTVWAVWNDLFHEDVPDEFLYKAFSMMEMAVKHTFLILTKRPERMKEFVLDYFAWESPDGDEGVEVSKNIWLGITAENQEQADKRIPVLLQIPAAVRFVSLEPLLGPIVLRKKAANEQEIIQATLMGLLDDYTRPVETGIDWVICGGESGPKARPLHPTWVQSLRDQCQAAEVPFFFKQWGEFADCTKKGTGRGTEIILAPDGEILGLGYNKCGGVDPDWEKKGGAWMYRTGKKVAGRLLDGKTWDEMPRLTAS